MDLDARVRVAAFTFLSEQTRLLGEVLPRTQLAQGFAFEGRHVRLISPQGIFKPAILPELPMTITTVPTVAGRDRPYEDEIGDWRRHDPCLAGGGGAAGDGPSRGVSG